eukprot:CAMPEP_0194106358 /NCGR_PEP_ID=MMETSP0150-20130528/6393_1 /TAXON_ID=122233 /ORGANISM="Chaetoceros debilis, Strain MM31A-1" /LENGTH=286 /DNA_ID=CAMNT_0038794481 /DNA_START=149 /DNA_END=1009 /DNA_ORIENTATION=-
MSFFKNPIAAQEKDGVYEPSSFTRFVGMSNKTKYKKQKQQQNEKYTGSKPILVVCTDESLLEMENKLKFSTGNHPVEMFVPMLHFQDAGFDFEFATLTGADVKLELWAYPVNDEHVKRIHDEMREKMDNPKKLSDIISLDDYSALFIPGGHGCLINLPKSADLGRILHMAHQQEFPTVTLCHGPGALLASCAEGTDKEFAYNGYKIMCFTDKTDKMTPSIGYLPGHMPWLVQKTLEKKGMTILNKTENGAVTQDRELITGDSPTAAEPLGVFAAPILVKWANKNKA